MLLTQIRGSWGRSGRLLGSTAQPRGGSKAAARFICSPGGPCKRFFLDISDITRTSLSRADRSEVGRGKGRPPAARDLGRADLLAASSGWMGWSCPAGLSLALSRSAEPAQCWVPSRLPARYLPVQSIFLWAPRPVPLRSGLKLSEQGGGCVNPSTALAACKLRFQTYECICSCLGGPPLLLPCIYPLEPFTDH